MRPFALSLHAALLGGMVSDPSLSSDPYPGLAHHEPKTF
jgi:hypothetical protein